MFSKFTKILRLELSAELLVPVVIIVLYVAFLLSIRGTLPTSEDLVAHLSSLYERFGYELIFIGATLEALVMVNFFVPGAVAVAFGAVFARSGQLDLTYAVLAAVSGAILGFIIDFILGYFGFGEILKRLGYGNFLTQAREAIEYSGIRTFGLGFIHPNIGSFVSLAAGTLKMRFINFLIFTALSTLIWVSFWGILVFALGEVFLVILTKYIWVLILLVLSAWILTTMYGSIKKTQK